MIHSRTVKQCARWLVRPCRRLLQSGSICIWCHWAVFLQVLVRPTRFVPSALDLRYDPFWNSQTMFTLGGLTCRRLLQSGSVCIWCHWAVFLQVLVRPTRTVPSALDLHDDPFRNSQTMCTLGGLTLSEAFTVQIRLHLVPLSRFPANVGTSDTLCSIHTWFAWWSVPEQSNNVHVGWFDLVRGFCNPDPFAFGAIEPFSCKCWYIRHAPFHPHSICAMIRSRTNNVHVGWFDLVGGFCSPDPFAFSVIEPFSCKCWYVRHAPFRRICFSPFSRFHYVCSWILFRHLKVNCLQKSVPQFI